MKKLILKSRFLILIPVILGLLLVVVSCEKDETINDEIEAVDTSDTSAKIFYPDDPDFRPPRIPEPPRYTSHCMVRLSYLNYLRRCPENASVVTHWINVLNTQGFDDLTKGFVTSHEASVKWNSQYQSFLSRNNLNSVELHKFIYIIYRGMLLREPDVNGGKGWTNVFYDHGIKFVANGIANSQEYQNRLARIHNECNNAANQCTY